MQNQSIRTSSDDATRRRVASSASITKHFGIDTTTSLYDHNGLIETLDDPELRAVQAGDALLNVLMACASLFEVLSAMEEHRVERTLDFLAHVRQVGNIGRWLANSGFTHLDVLIDTPGLVFADSSAVEKQINRLNLSCHNLQASASRICGTAKSSELDGAAKSQSIQREMNFLDETKEELARHVSELAETLGVHPLEIKLRGNDRRTDPT